MDKVIRISEKVLKRKTDENRDKSDNYRGCAYCGGKQTTRLDGYKAEERSGLNGRLLTFHVVCDLCKKVDWPFISEEDFLYFLMFC